MSTHLSCQFLNKRSLFMIIHRLFFATILIFICAYFTPGSDMYLNLLLIVPIGLISFIDFFVNSYITYNYGTLINFVISFLVSFTILYFMQFMIFDYGIGVFSTSIGSLIYSIAIHGLK